MFVKSCENLNDDEAQQFSKFLTEYADVFSKEDDDLGRFKELKFIINTGDFPTIFIELGQCSGTYSQDG